MNSYSQRTALPSKRKYGASSDSWMPGYDDDIDEDLSYAQQTTNGTSFGTTNDEDFEGTAPSPTGNKQDLAARLRQLKKVYQGAPQSNHIHTTKRLKEADHQDKGLNNTALLSLNNEFTNLIAQDSLYLRTKARYEAIIKDSTNHEREVTDLLRLAREKSDFSLVTNLEGKLFTARDRRVRAERIVDGLEKCRRDVEEIVTTIAVLDEHVTGVKEKLRELCEQ